MEGKITFQEAIDYGMTKLTAKEEGKQMGNSSVKQESPVLPVDKLEEKAKTIDCKNCFIATLEDPPPAPQRGHGTPHRTK